LNDWQPLTDQQPKANTQKPQEALEPKIRVIAAKPLTHPVLCHYLTERKIPAEIAGKYCKEVDFELNDRRYFAIGFENRSGEFELRNEHFKGGRRQFTKRCYPHQPNRSQRHFCFRRFFQLSFLPNVAEE